MPELTVGTTSPRVELEYRVARMFEQDDCPRNIIARIIHDTTFTELHQLATLPRINHVDRLSSCFARGDTYFDGDTLSILVDEEHRRFVNINVNDDARARTALNEQMLAESQEAIRRALGIESTHGHTNEHDDAQDIVGTLRDVLVSPILDTSTVTARFEYGDCIGSDIVKPTDESMPMLSEKDEKMIKVANIIKDSMLVELELFYNPCNDTFELSAIDESTDSKVLILKGHGKDKADLLKEHFEL